MKKWEEEHKLAIANIGNLQYYIRFWPGDVPEEVNPNKCLYPVVTTFFNAEKGQFHQCIRNKGHGKDGLLCVMHAAMKKMK